MSLVELMAALAIVALLMGLIVKGVHKLRQAADEADRAAAVAHVHGR
jgi:type II secretory pathway pseudopilin PulG